MSLAVSRKALPDLDWQIAKSLNPVGSFYTVSNLDGTVRSVQPDGSIQARPAGTSGAFELCSKSALGLSYCPDSQHVYVFALVESLPNV